MLRSDIKGRLGESLVALLFERQRWSVKAVGVENLVTLEGRMIKDSKSGNAARYLPDLLACHDEAAGLRLLFVEVKTHREAPRPEDLERYLRYDGVLIVWVGPSGIRAAWVLKEGDRLPAGEDYKPIESVPSLFFDHAPMEPFHEYAARIHGVALATPSLRVKAR